MDPNVLPGAPIKQTMGAREVSNAEEIILQAIDISQQCFWPDILAVNNGRVSVAALSQATNNLKRAGAIRLREDDMEHAIEYIRRKQNAN